MQPRFSFAPHIPSFSPQQLRVKTRLSSLPNPYITRLLRRTSSLTQITKMGPRSTGVTELREAALPIFSKPGFKNLVWAGVHGALAYGEEDTSDGDVPTDVNIVAVWNPKAAKGWDPLEKERHASVVEKLQQAWNREFDVLDVTGGRLENDYQASAMLCSRTLYGSAKDQLVMSLRKEARATVDQGRQLFSGAITKISNAQKLGAKTKVEVAN